MAKNGHDGLRSVVRTLEGVRTSDGAGVALTRIIGSPELEMLDPFLLLKGIMIGLGIIGQYLARVYDELKRRPSYLVADELGFEQPTQSE